MTVLRNILLVISGLFVLLMIFGQNKSPNTVPLVRPLPISEARFVSIIDQSRADYRRGENSMAKGASRPARARALCQEFSSRRVIDWIGQVSLLTSNSDGKGVFGVQIAKDLQLKTWNNAISDTSYQTLMEPGSAVFNQAVATRKDQWVRFSGYFSESDTDCFREQSMTLGGSIAEPEFVFRFTGVVPTE